MDFPTPTTGAIAPVVGTSVGTVHSDQQVSSSGHLNETPEPDSEGEADEGSGQTGEADEATESAPVADDSASPEPRKVTGMTQHGQQRGPAEAADIAERVH